MKDEKTWLGRNDSLAGTDMEDSGPWVLTGTGCRSVLSWKMIFTVIAVLRVLDSPSKTWEVGASVLSSPSPRLSSPT